MIWKLLLLSMVTRLAHGVATASGRVYRDSGGIMIKGVNAEAVGASTERHHYLHIWVKTQIYEDGRWKTLTTQSGKAYDDIGVTAGDGWGHIVGCRDGKKYRAKVLFRIYNDDNVLVHSVPWTGGGQVLC